MKRIILCLSLFAFFGSQAQQINPVPDYVFSNKMSVGRNAVTDTAAYFSIGPRYGAIRGMMPPMVTDTASMSATKRNGLLIFSIQKNKYLYWDSVGSKWAEMAGTAGSAITGSGVAGYMPEFTTSTNLDTTRLYHSAGRFAIGSTTTTSGVFNVYGGQAYFDTSLKVGTQTLLADEGKNEVYVNTTSDAGAYALQVAGSIYNTNDAYFGVSSGRLGVGTSTGAGKISSIQTGVVSPTNSAYWLSHDGSASSTDGLAIGTNGSASYKWIQSYNGALSINSAGNDVLIGTTTDAGAYALQVAGAIYGTTDAQINSVKVGRGSGGISTNTAIGSGALNANTTADNNTAIGYNALNTGNASQNTGVGSLALQASVGFGNTAVGYAVMDQATGGYQNTVIGRLAFRSNSSGINNSAMGNAALAANTTAENNVAIGAESLQYITTGGSNTAIGYQSGRLITAGTNNTTSNNSIYIGQDSRASANGNTNEIVIGYNGRGNGSNTVTIGNSSTTDNYFFGALRTSAPPGGTANAWRLGTVATVTPTSPNRTIEVSIGGTIYYIHAKTTND